MSLHFAYYEQQPYSLKVQSLQFAHVMKKRQKIYRISFENSNCFCYLVVVIFTQPNTQPFNSPVEKWDF